MWEIRFATAKDVEAIHALWQASFPTDTPEDITAFLSVVNLPDECMLLCEKGQPISMGFFLPARLHTLQLRYLYAAATLPAHRGKGAFAHLLQVAQAHYAAGGVDAVFLNPASPSLVGYYQRLGYRPRFFTKTVTGTALPSAVSICPLTAEAYVTRRSMLLPPVSVRWDDRFVLCEAKGSQAFAIGETGVALCRIGDDILRVTELLGVEDTAVCAALAAYCGVGSYTARVAASSGDCFGMVLPLTASCKIEGTPYMGLAFD